MSKVYQSLIIIGNKDKERVDALIDTGANVNVMTYNFAIKIYHEDFLEKMFKEKLNYVNATEKIRLSGIFVLGHVIIRKEPRPVDFFITKERFGAPVLIGVEYMQRIAGQVDFVNDKLRFRKLSRRKGYWI